MRTFATNRRFMRTMLRAHLPGSPLIPRKIALSQNGYGPPKPYPSPLSITLALTTVHLHYILCNLPPRPLHPSRGLETTPSPISAAMTSHGILDTTHLQNGFGANGYGAYWYFSTCSSRRTATCTSSSRRRSSSASSTRRVPGWGGPV